MDNPLLIIGLVLLVLVMLLITIVCIILMTVDSDVSLMLSRVFGKPISKFCAIMQIKRPTDYSIAIVYLRRAWR